MSSKSRNRSRKTVGKPSGEHVPLVIPIPGGMAHFHHPSDITPRMSRDVEIIGAEIMPRLQELANASTITVDGQVAAESDVLDGMPVGLTRDEIRSFLEFQDAQVACFLKSWTLERDLPGCGDDVADLPRALHQALTEHVAKLALASERESFTADDLPDDEDGDTDPDLPT